MRDNQANRSQLLPRISSTASAAAQLLAAVLIGGLAFLLTDKLAWNVLVPSSFLALSVVGAIVWQQSRTNARRRFLAALDAYAEREISQSPGRKTYRD